MVASLRVFIFSMSSLPLFSIRAGLWDQQNMVWQCEDYKASHKWYIATSVLFFWIAHSGVSQSHDVRSFKQPFGEPLKERNQGLLPTASSSLPTLSNLKVDLIAHVKASETCSPDWDVTIISWESLLSIVFQTCSWPQVLFYPMIVKTFLYKHCKVLQWITKLKNLDPVLS